MAARAMRLARVASNAARPLVQPVPHSFTRCCANVTFSRAFSLNAPASAPPIGSVDLSSTVAEMRDFAILHGISLKGLRLKADIFAAIQMHFGVFVKVDAGAHSAGLKQQEEVAVAPSSWEEEGDLQLKVVSTFCNLFPSAYNCSSMICSRFFATASRPNHRSNSISFFSTCRAQAHPLFNQTY